MKLERNARGDGPGEPSGTAWGDGYGYVRGGWGDGRSSWEDDDGDSTGYGGYFGGRPSHILAEAPEAGR